MGTPKTGRRKTSARRIARILTEPLWRRDKLEMRIADAVLAAVEPKRTRRKRPGKSSR
jgi:hypothetical protein